MINGIAIDPWQVMEDPKNGFQACGKYAKKYTIL
jgi:hypothetical protein